MDIKIMGHRRAARYVPKVPTLAIRIFDSHPVSSNRPSLQLKDSSLYTICGYTFDDTDLDAILWCEPDIDVQELYKRDVILDRKLARGILNDFVTLSVGCKGLLVHCALGASRSPAVAMALNEIFGLGYDTEAMKKERFTYNRHVYRLLVEEGKKL